MLLLTLALYTGIGLCTAILACCLRRQCMPGVVIGGTICGTVGAFVAGVMFGPTLGPMVAGISVLPCLTGAVIGVGSFELLARQLFVKPNKSAIIQFPNEQSLVERKAVA